MLKIGKGRKKKGKEKERKKNNLETSTEKIHKFIIVHFQVPAASWEIFLRKSGRICPTPSRLRQKHSLLCVAHAFANPVLSALRNEIYTLSMSKVTVLISQLHPQRAKSGRILTLLLRGRTQALSTPPHPPAPLIFYFNLPHFIPVTFKANPTRKKYNGQDQKK